MKPIYLKSAVVALLVIGTGAFALPRLTKNKPKVVKKEQSEVFVPPVLDSQVVAKFTQVTQQLDVTDKDLLLVGTMTASDGADTTAKMNSVPYIFSKADSSFYFKLGSTETINANGIYLLVDHASRKVVLGAQRKMESPVGMFNMAQVVQNIEGEGYHVESQLQGETEKITFLNNFHMSCKEYALSFNAKTLQPERIFVRVSNPENPEEIKKDKKIEVKLSKWSRNANLPFYTSQQFVTKTKRGWELGKAFKHYELIML